MTNSIRKGKRFELEVAHLLTKYLGKEFKRVPMSGAFATTQQTKNPIFKGDVFTEDKDFGTVIECKRIKKVTPSIMKKWIQQCKREAGLRNNFWLIFKEDRKPIQIIRGYWRTRKENYIVMKPVDFLEFITKGGQNGKDNEKS